MGPSSQSASLLFLMCHPGDRACPHAHTVVVSSIPSHRESVWTVILLERVAFCPTQSWWR